MKKANFTCRASEGITSTVDNCTELFGGKRIAHNGRAVRKWLFALSCLVAILAFSSNVSIAQTTWTGGGDGVSWDDAGNWDTGVPAAGVDAIIPAGFVGPTSSASNVDAESLTIGAGASATWPAGFTLTIDGAGGDGIDNDGTFNNHGTIDITDKGGDGIMTSGTFTNGGGFSTGTINIDGGGGLSTNRGIHVDGGFFFNGTLTGSGVININNTTSHGVRVNNGAFMANRFSGARLSIGQTGPVGGDGIKIIGAFLNSDDDAEIRIDQVGGDGIMLDAAGATFESSGATALVLIGDLGLGIGGHGVNNSTGGSFTNASGALLDIQDIAATNHGIRNAGTVENGVSSATIDIDLAGVGDHGILNTGSGTFNNGDTGVITVDDSANDGIRNNGNFTNNGVGAGMAMITITNAGAQGLENNAGATFTNRNTSMVTITGSVLDGIQNDGDIINQNAGTISIDNSGDNGIMNNAGATLTNENASSSITIDNSVDNGIQNGGTVTNDDTATINIDNSGTNGIENNDSVTNSGGATINVETSGGHGIDNTTAFISDFTNTGSTINVGVSGGTITGNGINNQASAAFNNISGATINIDPVADGINNAGFFLNIDSDININDAGDDGIENSAQFPAGIFASSAIAGDANINIGPNIGSHGVNNSGSFTNQGLGAGLTATLHIDGAGGSIGGTGITNTGAAPFGGVVNGGGATAGTSTILIDQVTSHGIDNQGVFSSNGGSGSALIGIGTDGPGAIGGDGINNSGDFDNQSNSTIDIDRADGDGINNNGGATFNNSGLAPNAATINVDLVDGDGIENTGGAFFFNDNNASVINIGATNPVDAHGVNNNGGADFQNIDGGLLNIVEVGRNCTVHVPAHGILNDAATFTNGDAFPADVNVDETNCGNAKDGTGSDGLHNINGGVVTNQTTGSTFTIGATNIIDDGVYNGPGSTVNNQDGASLSTTNTGGHGINNEGTFNNMPAGGAAASTSVSLAACNGYNGAAGSALNNLGGSTITIINGVDGYYSDGFDTNDGSTITIGDCAGGDPSDDGMELGASAFFSNDNGAFIDINGATDDGLVTAGFLTNDNGSTIDIDCTGDDGFVSDGGTTFNGFIAAATMNIGLNVATGDDGLFVETGIFNNFSLAVVNIDNAGGDAIEVGNGAGGVLFNGDATINVLGATGNAITNTVNGAISSAGTDNDPILSVVNIFSGGAACDGTHPISNAGGIVAGNCSVWNVNAKVDNTPGGSIQVDNAYWMQECGGTISAMGAAANFINHGVVYDPNRHFGHGTLLDNHDLVIDTDPSLSVSFCDETIEDILLNEVDTDGQDAQAEETWYFDMARTMVAGTYDNTTNVFTPAVTPMTIGNHTFWFLVHKNAAAGAPLDACASILGSVDILVRNECYQLTNFPGVGDPCSCLDDASVNGNDGTFAEEVAVAGVYNQPLPAGQTWTVVSMIGIYDMNDAGTGPGTALVPTGAQPAGYTTYMFAGTEYLQLEYNAGDGFYEIDFHHVDAQGYEIFVQGPFPDTDGDPTTIEPTNFLLSIGNTCFYPHPTLVAPSFLCADSAPFNVEVLDVDAAVNERAAGAKFDDDADPTTTEAVSWLDGETGAVDPMDATFPSGSVTIWYHYDAPDAPAGTHAPGCLETASITFEVNPDLSVTASVDSNADCLGSEDGSASAVGAGGTAPYSYAWSNGQTGTSATGLAAGGYAVTITDANGCTAVDGILITDPSGIMSSITAVTNADCNGASTGSLTVTATGGTPGYTYLWSDAGAQTTATATGLASGTYTVTSTDANGCTTVASATVDQPTLLIAEIVHSSDALCNGSSDGTATVNATGGTTGYTYLWDDAGAQTTATATGLAAGTYNVTVTDANSCTATTSVTIGEPTAVSGATAGTDPSCNGGSDGSIDLTISGGTGPYNVAWDNGAQDVEDPNGLAAGTYNYTITDDNGCTATGSETLTDPAAITDAPVSTTDVLCHGGADGTATVTPGGGTGALTVSWSNGQSGATATGLAAGGYDYTITDANGCTLIGGVTISEPTELVASTTAITDVDCNGAATGSITFAASGGTPAYSYDIGGGGQAGGTFTGLTAGTYVVTVTDANGCTALSSGTIDQPTLVSVTVVASYDETCDGADDGWATVEANGGTTAYSYAWPASAGSQTTATATGLADGTYTVTATDANGCTGTADVTIGAGPALAINALGDIGPLCPGAGVGDILLSSVPADAGVSYSWTGGAAAGLADGTSTGLNAAIPGFTASTTEQVVTITVTATFGAGCSDTETFDITIEDSNSLTFVNCPSSFTVNSDVGKCGANVNWSAPVAADDCTNAGAITVTLLAPSPAPGSFLAPGTHTVTYEADDGNGNTVTCSFDITVVDMENPVIACASAAYTRGTNTGCTFVMGSTDFDAAASDNCGVASLTNSYNATGTLVGAIFPLGNTAVTWTATDAAGNASSCTQTITVVDDDAPTVATCPANISVNTDAGLCSAVVAYATPTFDDNCDGAGLAGSQTEGLASGAAFPEGTTVVEYEYTDAAGNGPAVCSFTVTVTDIEVPTINCPASYSVQCDIEDAHPYANSNEFLAAGGLLMDNCGVNYGSFGLISEVEAPAGTFTRIYAVQDIHGNANFCTQIVTVEDTTDPVAMCQDDYGVVLDADGLFEILVADINVGSYDNCGELVRKEISIDGGPFAGSDFVDCDDAVTGSVTVTLEVEDASGNTSTCDVTVSVFDVDAPHIECANVNYVRGTNVDCTFTMGSDAFDAAATDNCGAAVTNDYNGTATLSGANFPLGNTTVEWTATDPSGNFATCSLTITVVDDDDPTVATCPGDDTVTNDAGVCGAVYTYADPTFDDNCDGTGLAGALVEGLASGSTFPVGTTTVTYTYNDAAGNGPAVCSFDVTVTDDEDPTLTCPGPETAQCSADEVPEYDNWQEFTSAGGSGSDNCDLALGTFGLQSETTAGNVVTRTYRIEDIYGNWTTCTQDITILDTIDPEFSNCPTGPIVVGNDVDECSAKVNWSIPVATDNCGVVDVTHDGAVSGSVLAVGSHTATYTATDLAGNTDVCEITIMVMDTQDPHIHVCPADRDIPTSSNAPAYDCMGVVPDMTGEVEYIENCNAVVTQDPAAGSLFGGAPGDQVVVTFTVTDDAGNTATCTNTLTLVDDEAPMAICVDLTVGLDVFGNASVTAADLAGGSFDNCGAVTLEVVSGQTAYDCDDVGGSYDVVIRVTDTSGNTAECTSTVTVEEGAATCVPVISINDPCVCSAIPGYFDETVTVMALAGQTWTVTAISGLYSAPGTPITVGTTLTEGPLGAYVLTGIHEAGVGYSITVENEFGEQLSASNTCYNPDPSISGVDDFSTSCDDPFTVTGNENGITGEAGTVLTITGPAGYSNSAAFPGPYSLTVTPADLQPGDYEVCFSLDAGAATNNDPSDPGCVVTVCESFEIIDPVSGLSCNSLVNVSLDDVCCVEITPDMVLEGNFGPDGVFDVTITDIIGTPLSPANEVCANHIGMDLIVTVTDPCTNQSCWGELNIEDKLAPTVDCPADVTVYCNEDTEPGNTGYPGVTDCSAWDMDYTDDETFYDACDVNIRTIVRTFVVIDVHGNQAECTQTITVERPALDDIHFPEDIQWTCDNYNVYPNIITATPRHAYVGDSDAGTPNFYEVVLDETCDDDDGNLVGFCHIPAPGTFDDTKDREDTNSTNTVNGGLGCPGEVCGNNGLDDADVLELTGSGIPLLGGNAIQGVGACMLSVTWDDEWFEICSGSFEILRTWKVRDMCLPVSADNPRVHVQVIKVLDQSAPTLDCPAAVTVSANVAASHPDECRADFFLPEIGIDDSCSEGWTVEVDHPLGHIDGNGGFVSGLARGSYEATYTVIDDCNNVATCEVVINVVDDIAPTVQCDEITQVAVSSDGQVVVNAEVFDDGTHDNCCLDNFEVKRMGQGDNAFGPTETFTCNDINNSPITVVMRAYDCDGNYNDCMVQVYVEDKLQPILISCPASQRITCDTWWDEYEVPLALGQNSVLDGPFGTPEYTDNCNYSVNYTFNVNLDECGEGSITRTWQATDPSGNGPVTCTQVIWVDHVSDWVVEFPADVDYTCTQTAPDFGEPEIYNESCELIAVSFEDELFNSVPDACYKIKRTWTVINWCVVGDFVDNEVIEVAENELGLPYPLCDLDGDGDCDDKTFRDSWNAGDRPTAANATDVFGPDTDPDTDPWDGYITYEQHIKVSDNVAPVATCQDEYEVCIEDNTCVAAFTVPTPDVDDCSSEISITADSDLPNFNSTSFDASNVAPGTYTVTFQIMDNCGNSTACQTEVAVDDCKKPTPYCKNGIIVEIMQTQMMIEVWATDLNDGSFDNCTDSDDLIISFSGSDYVQGVTYTCDDIGFNNVEIWVTDEAGNQDYCTTQIQVQDNMDHCGGSPLVVSGTIMNEEDEEVALVDVELNGGAQMVTTADNGQFSFNVTPGDDISITPMKDIEPLNGVTTFDLVLITKHILGVKELNTPYKLIAADINKSETITTFDLVKLRKLILHIDDNFTNNTSWRFVDASYVFPDETNPWSEQFPEVVNINNINANALADFIAVKVGDVNLSADPLAFNNADDRSKVNDLVFQIEEAEMTAGETYTVDFKAKDFDVLGYQFTLNFDKDALDFVELLPGVATAENFGTTLLEEGAITASWNDDAAKVADGEVVFSLVFTATADAQLSESLNVNSRYTPAEAYANDGELLDVALEFNGTTVAGVFELYQNSPNPFEKTTTIGFNLPQADAASLTISDATGRVLQIIEGDYKKGYNEVALDRKSLNAAGVLYYQLETSTDIATKTMILVD